MPFRERRFRANQLRKRDEALVDARFARNFVIAI
jgi:hypothetical protein